ncbi:fimbrial biogenesis chaperone [Erwinia sorbitola]|uniref:Fimbria/pilus periplasmic chaperone n=1 Tax=Erwinia sorbitola TaxID=2681984 RepID=A0ABW9REV8_9GAMM|nr:fimbria/pilus periplasmic chaperone [Erwinia sorbitola]MTD28728.1 fimbria/pilus periplasmic chaperone [Erwinia sorbitola]
MSVVRNLHQRAYKLLPACILLPFAVIAHQANANVIIHATRVIYPQDQREVNIQLTNDAERPSLIQSWIDDGDDKSSFNNTSVPFVLTPPIIRVEPNSGQTLRLTWTGGASLPQDKESIFWLNILDIPPKNTDTPDANMLQMAIRSRLKVFFRPPALSAEGAKKAFYDLQWKYSPSAPKTVLVVNNPSPYFVNISNVKIERNKKEIKSLKGEMIAPGSAAEFRFTALPDNIKNDEIRYEAINDHGSVITIKTTQKTR